MTFKFLIVCALVAFAAGSEKELMNSDQTPNPGNDNPETVYKPGNPGANWAPEEVDAIRDRILQMITPIWPEKVILGTGNIIGMNRNLGETTENTLLRLAFHDCIPYLDGGDDDRACDGCLNFEGMFNEVPSANIAEHIYKFDPPTNTNNQGLAGVAVSLEKIYKSIDWPFSSPINPDITTSLYQSGKSRSDLWQFAGMVALERSIERANRACDLDFHVRQQTTILESRDACEIKLEEPLKFVTGRIDCNNKDEELNCITEDDKEEHGLSDAGFVTCKKENQPEIMGDGKHLFEYGTEVMNVDLMKWIALQAIHGAVHAGSAGIGTKYTWFGSGYLGNMFFRMIADKPIYRMMKRGGDLAFLECIGQTGSKLENRNIAVGDPQGNPIPQTSWRASCMYVWNTTEGGPCMLRPINPKCPDSQHWLDPDTTLSHECLTYNDPITDEPIINREGWRAGICPDAYFNSTTTKTGYQFNLLMSGRKEGQWNLDLDNPFWEDVSDASYDTLSVNAQRLIHACNWNNQFAFPWEIGMYWDFKVGKPGRRAIGCEGLDKEFGVVNPESEWDPKWPLQTRFDGAPRHTIFGSPAMQCDKVADSFDGIQTSEIIDNFATDNELWAKNFLSGWHQMITNGYSKSDLVDGPENGWLGYYSLTQQAPGSRLQMSFADYIAENTPVTFIDPAADPYICGHRGHFVTSCGIRFSQFFHVASQPDADACSLEPCSREGQCDIEIDE